MRVSIESCRIVSARVYLADSMGGRNAPGPKMMNLLGQAVPKAGASRQKFIIPIGN